MHSSIFIAALSLPLVLCSGLSKRDCNDIALGGHYAAEGYTTTYPTTFMVSQPLNCTQELASSDGDNDSRRCAFKRYAEGLEVHSTLNITVSDPQQVFDRIKQASDQQHVDFNETIVMNFTNPISSGYSVNFTGYVSQVLPLNKLRTRRSRSTIDSNGLLTCLKWGFTPFQRCFEGILLDCDGDDTATNATTFKACGLQILTLSDDPGRIQYDGVIAGVQWVGDYSKYANMTEPQPRYDDVKGNATYFENGGRVGATSFAGAWGGATAAVMWLMWWSIV